MDLIQEGIGYNMGTVFKMASSAITGMISGLIMGWELALLVLAFTPIVVISTRCLGKVLFAFCHKKCYLFQNEPLKRSGLRTLGMAIFQMVAQLTSKELKAYEKAGAVAEEALTSIRTVYAFGGQHKEWKKCALL